MSEIEECAICCAYGLPETERGEGTHPIEWDPYRDGLKRRDVWACDECWYEIKRGE